MASVRSSPVLGISIDTKKRDASLVISFWDRTQKAFCNMPLAKPKVPGENAEGLFETMKTALASKGVDAKRIASFTADGAGVNGVLGKREASVDPGGHDASINVAKKLAQHAGRKLLVAHCCGHKFQLATSQSWKGVEYLRELEKIVDSIYKYLEKSGKAQTALAFWEHVLDGGDVGSKSRGRSRWLSLHGPLHHMLGSYLALLAWLY